MSGEFVRDGDQPGANIRVAYLYDPQRAELKSVVRIVDVDEPDAGVVVTPALLRLVGDCPFPSSDHRLTWVDLKGKTQRNARKPCKGSH